MISCLGLLSCRRHIGKREDPGDEVGAADLFYVTCFCNVYAWILIKYKTLWERIFGRGRSTRVIL